MIARLLLGLWLLATVSGGAGAQDVVKVPRPPNFVRFAYHYGLLDEILRRTVGTHGPYIDQPCTEPLSTARIQQEAIKGELINVLALDVGSDLVNQNMIPIPYPIDKGLLGYRVALIVGENQARIGAISNLAGLRGLTVGRGEGWGDVRIFQHNGVPVETTPSYDSLFAMLARGRFDLFPRGITEAPQELLAFRERYPRLAIEQTLLIKYPYAQFFYVSRSEPRLAARIKLGLEAMLADGSFEAMFQQHFAGPIAELRLSERKVIELENPFLPEWVPFGREELWF